MLEDDHDADTNPRSEDESDAAKEAPTRGVPSKKRKGKSTRWNIPSHALNILDQVFLKDKFPTVETRKNLATDLKVTPRQVQVWFQNKRQRSVKPLPRVDVETHDMLSTSEDIRVALMKFGNGCVEPTRPQHEVFANDDTANKHMGKAGSIAFGSCNNSSAADAWMAAMHASTLQSSGSQPSRSFTHASADALPPSALSQWWRQTSGGFPPLSFPSSRSGSKWQLPFHGQMQQESGVQGLPGSRLLVPGMQAPFLSRSGGCSMSCGQSMPCSGSMGQAASTPMCTGQQQSLLDAGMSSLGRGSAASASISSRQDEEAGRSARHGSCGSPAIEGGMVASVDNALGDDSERQKTPTTVDQLSKPVMQQTLPPQITAGMLAETARLAFAQQWQQMQVQMMESWSGLPPGHRSAGHSQQPESSSGGSVPVDHKMRGQGGKAGQMQQLPSHSATLLASESSNGAASTVPTGSSLVDFPTDQLKSDFLMPELAAGRPSSHPGDEFMDEIIDSLFGEEMNVLQTSQRPQLSPTQQFQQMPPQHQQWRRRPLPQQGAPTVQAPPPVQPPSRRSLPLVPQSGPMQSQIPAPHLPRPVSPPPPAQEQHTQQPPHPSQFAPQTSASTPSCVLPQSCSSQIEGPEQSLELQHDDEAHQDSHSLFHPQYQQRILQQQRHLAHGGAMHKRPGNGAHDGSGGDPSSPPSRSSSGSRMSAIDILQLGDEALVSD